MHVKVVDSEEKKHLKTDFIVNEYLGAHLRLSVIETKKSWSQKNIEVRSLTINKSQFYHNFLSLFVSIEWML